MRSDLGGQYDYLWGYSSAFLLLGFGFFFLPVKLRREPLKLTLSMGISDNVRPNS